MSNIRDIPECERPYEKLDLYGERMLTNSELLSIIIKTGTRERTALEVAQDIINENTYNFNSLRFLQTVSIEELMRIKGVGKIKAIQLKAVGEIAKRISKPLNNTKIQITSREDIASLVMDELQNERNEILKLIMLDSKNIIKKIQNIAVGNEDNIRINIKQILSEPVKLQVPKLILVHNHPSGNSKPSAEDLKFTLKVKKAAELLDITLLDHIIIGDGNYSSVLD